MSKNTRNRILLTAVAALLLVVMTVGGTMAWLTDATEQVENTFTPTTLNVELEEQNPADRTEEMIPGATITKDPKVSYSSDVAAYVFVEVIESTNTVTVGTGDAAVTYDFDDFIDYAVIDGWIRLDGIDNRQEGVYYKNVAADESQNGVSVIQDAKGNANQVTIKSSVNKDMMDALKDATPDEFTLSFKSYIIQADNLTNAAGESVTGPQAAWAILKP